MDVVQSDDDILSGGGMSVRDQERRQKEAERRIGEAMRRADREVGKQIERRARAADIRADQIVRHIEKGDVEMRPLPGLREDSLPSMESMPSMESSDSMRSLPSADYAIGVDDVPADAGMMENMPLEGVMPYDPQSAHEDLAQRVTEETGSGGDPHAHAEQKAHEIAGQITEDTGAGGDMQLHAERKVEQAGQEMFEE